MKRLIECVPNFSEGRDPAKVQALVAAMSSVPALAVAIIARVTAWALTPVPTRRRVTWRSPRRIAGV